jgi:hypothetical protein
MLMTFKLESQAYCSNDTVVAYRGQPSASRRQPPRGPENNSRAANVRMSDGGACPRLRARYRQLCVHQPKFTDE